MQSLSTYSDSPWDEDDKEVLQETNKRITLNLLSQGAAVHTSLTAHHLVREELDELRPGLTKLYDKAAACFLLNYFFGDIPLVYGLPSRFWRRTHLDSHIYSRHQLLALHGRELWKMSKRFLIRRAWKKWVICIPVIQWFQTFWLLARVAWAERKIRPQLEELAKQANSQIWGIDIDQQDAKLTTNVAFGNLQVPRTAVGRMTRAGAIGYGGVERRRGTFFVVAKSWVWPLLTHELTKGTADLVSLHGLNALSDDLYFEVTDEADQIEHETWMLQAGSEMWRRFLAAIPRGQSLAETLMQVARLRPAALEDLMLEVVTDTTTAQRLIGQLV